MMARRSTASGCDRSQFAKGLRRSGVEVIVEALEPVGALEPDVGVAEVLVFPYKGTIICHLGGQSLPGITNVLLLPQVRKDQRGWSSRIRELI